MKVLCRSVGGSCVWRGSEELIRTSLIPDSMGLFSEEITSQCWKIVLRSQTRWDMGLILRVECHMRRLVDQLATLASTTKQ